MEDKDSVCVWKPFHGKRGERQWLTACGFVAHVEPKGDACFGCSRPVNLLKEPKGGEK